MRGLAAKLVLVIAILTTIATSQVPDPQIKDSKEIFAARLVHFTVTYSDAANEEAGRMEIQVYSETDGMLVPDDPGQPMQPIVNNVTISLDPSERCVEAGPCTLGFTIDFDADVQSRVQVMAYASRHADQAFVCNDTEEFSSAATVEVVFD